ncbi:MAG: membrane protein insertase YidC [Rhodobacteraceae bacterium]|nr:membrane protein insertase YidC [Paracoccaceae bacterium]
MNDQNKNMILATVLSMGVILVWLVLFPPEAAEEVPAQPLVAADGTIIPVAVGGDNLALPIAGDGGVAVALPNLGELIAETRETALATTDRVDIRTGKLSGSISLTGGRIDDLHLLEYNVELGDDNNKVTLLSPANTPDPYYAVWGWAATTAEYINDVPGANTVWQLESGDVLTETTPVTLIWDNGKGLVFRRSISVDENYMFDIHQSVQNNSDTDISLAPYGLIARHGEPQTTGFYLLHEGVVRAHDGEIEEIDYSDMPDFDVVPGDGPVDIIEVEENGWIGFTDKYWMTTLIPQAGQSFRSVAKYTDAQNTYRTDMRFDPMTVSAGQTVEIDTSLFAGAKVVNIIKAYQTDRNIGNLVDAVDWGMFYFLTKPMQWLLATIHGFVGNMGLAIIGLTLTVKLVLFPLAYKSAVSMAKMKKLAPEMAKIKERAGKDKQQQQKDTMALYKKEKVNPAAGCLPIIVQIPIFFSLYKVLFVTIEMRHAPFFGWITDLSAPDSSSWINLFGLLPYDVSWAPSLISIGIFPLLMGITMWMQQKLNPAPTDKTQAMIFAWMPWVFMFMLGNFAVGLVIYWVANNTITFIQQYLIMRSQGVKPDVFGNIISGFKKKKKAD